MLVAVVDFESVGDPPQPVEFGVVYLHMQGQQAAPAGAAGALLRWRGAVDPASRAVHHIAPGSLRRARHAGSVLRRHWRPGVQVVAAHNAEFDIGLLAVALRSAGLPLPPAAVCTLRCARHLLPGQPGYGLQVLRYSLGVQVHPPAWAQPHRAAYDAAVCAALLRRLLSWRTLPELAALSDASLPALQATVGFGEHRGKGWNEVPWDYLRWMMRTVARDPSAFDLDARHSARTEIVRRRKELAKEDGTHSRT